MRLLACLLSAFLLLTGSVPTGGMQIHISKIRNDEGVIRLAFFTDSKSFEAEKPKYGKTLSKKDMKDGCLSVSYADIPAGRYGIALLDDEDGNGKMEYRFFIPGEGFGFSNYYHTGIGKPDFDQFAFDYPGGAMTIRIKVKYL